MSRRERGSAAMSEAVPSAGGRDAIRIIEPPQPRLGQWLGEMRYHRATFFYFMRRFLRKRYGRTFFGYLWFVLPVLIPLFMGALVFGGILGVSGGDVPYFLFFTVASSAWFTFAQTAYYSTRSLEISRAELRRVYAPRLFPQTAAMALPLVNLVIYAVIGTIAVIYYVLADGVFYLDIRPETLLYPVAIAMLIVLGIACGLWFSPLAARARDVRRLAGYVLGFWYFLTPVLYPLSKIPASYRFLAELNPVTAPLELAKDALIGGGGVTLGGMAAYVVALVLLVGFGLPRYMSAEREATTRYY